MSLALLKPKQRSAEVVDLADGLVEGFDEWPLLPNDLYRATLVRHVCLEMTQFKGACKVFLHFRIVDPGDYFGAMVYRAYRVKRIISPGATKPIINGRFALYRRSELLLDYCRVMDLRERRADRISLRDMRRIVVQIKTRTVSQDARQRPLPEELRYSVVDTIVGRDTEWILPT